MVVASGADFGMKSNCIQLGALEQAARLKPQAAMATTRFIDTIHSLGQNGRFTTRSGATGKVEECPHAHSPQLA
jgi:hypothetical protein